MLRLTKRSTRRLRRRRDPKPDSSSNKPRLSSLLIPTCLFPRATMWQALARVAKAAEDLQCRYSEVKYWATISIGWSLISRCLIRPLGPELTGDLRCRFVQGNFFALAASEAGFDPAVPARRFDAVLVDIDHSPDFLLDPQNAAFYGEQGLSQLAAHLRPGGIFALWSNDRPDDAFTARLRRIFADARAEEVTFHNPLQDKPFTQTVYLAKKQIWRRPIPRSDGV